MAWPEVVLIDGNRRFAGGDRRKGTSSLRRLRASGIDSSCTESLSTMAVLMVVTEGSGEAYLDGDGRRVSGQGFGKKRKSSGGGRNAGR
jgi:hypothetical protein